MNISAVEARSPLQHEATRDLDNQGNVYVSCGDGDDARELLLRHLTLDDEAYHLVARIATHGDGLLEMAGELALAIVGNVDLTLLTCLDGSLGEGGHGATTAGQSLVDDEGSRTGVGELEGALAHGVANGEIAQVALQGVELDLGIVVLAGLSGGRGLLGTAHEG